MVSNRIIKTELIEWRKIQNLQPDKFKNLLNSEDIKNSILKHGFAQPFYVWENAGKIFAIDGHTRKQILLGINDVPDLLPATFIYAENRKEAISILIEVYNQKQNKINQSSLTEWLEIEDLKIDSIGLDICFDIIDTEVNHVDDHWKGMPEFHQENLEPIKQIIVSFSSEKDMQEFADLVGQLITSKTKSIWYPKQEHDDVKDLRYGHE